MIFFRWVFKDVQFLMNDTQPLKSPYFLNFKFHYFHPILSQIIPFWQFLSLFMGLNLKLSFHIHAYFWQITD